MDNSKNIFLTGATGYIGTHLLKALISDGWRVHVIVRDINRSRQIYPSEALHIHPYDGDINSVLRAFEISRPKLVVHLAALYISEHQSDQIQELISSNVTFGVQILEAMSKFNVSKLITAGTSWQNFYSERYSPVNLYSATKQAFEDILQYYIDAYKMEAITLRLYDTYGPEDWRGKLFSLLIDASKSGEFIELSPGDQKVSLVHIFDVTAAFLKAINLLSAMNSSDHFIYYLPAKEACSIKELVGIIENITKKKINIRWGAKPYRTREVMNPWISNNILPGWNEAFTLRSGVLDVISE